MSGLRVLHVKADVNPEGGGSVTAIMSAIRSSLLSGHSATLLSTRLLHEDHHIALARESPDAAIVILPRARSHTYSPTGSLWNWLERNIRLFDVVVIHEVFSFPAVAAAHWARRAGVPYVIRPHGSLDPYDMRKHSRLKTLLRPVFGRYLQNSAGIWLTAQKEAERAVTYGVAVPRFVSVLPVPRPEFVGRPDAFRARVGAAPSDFVWLFLGRLDRKKGLERTIAAYSAVRRPSSWLVIAGSGDPEYERELRMASCADPSIVFLGFVRGQERADAFAGADLFVLHSDNENFGLAPVEALHHGLPSLLSDQVFVSDLLADCAAASVVSVSDLDGLRHLMRAAECGDLARPDEDHLASALAIFDPIRVARLDGEILEQVAARREDRR